MKIHSSVIYNNDIVINGQKVPSFPKGKANCNNISVINNHVYANGYELVNGEWKRTFLAWFHLYF